MAGYQARVLFSIAPRGRVYPRTIFVAILVLTIRKKKRRGVPASFTRRFLAFSRACYSYDSPSSGLSVLCRRGFSPPFSNLTILSHGRPRPGGTYVLPIISILLGLSLQWSFVTCQVDVRVLGQGVFLYCTPGKGISPHDSIAVFVFTIREKE